MAKIDFEELVQAIRAQESGGRNVISRNPKTGAPIAYGPMQITKPTWADYAKPGEDINNPTHNEAVARRILAAHGERFNWDAHKMAQAYFAGPGGVGKNRSDALGQSTNKYGDEIIQRLSGGAQSRPATFQIRKPDATEL